MKVTEIYTKDDKNIDDLIQEWINENYNILYSKIDSKEEEHNHN